MAIGPDDLAFAREVVVDRDFRRGHVRVFEVRPRAEPVIRPDDRGIVAARFVEPQALLAEGGLPPFIRAHLNGTVGGGGPRSAACGRPRRTRR